MPYSREYPGPYKPLSKVHYRPIEAAIRWSGLAPHERRILAALQDKVIPEPGDFPEWPALRLNTERIYDAILNEELPCAVDGITVHDRSGIEHPNLTVRHVHLKSWMSRYYPEQRPDFLFSWIEQIAHPTITIDAVHALVLERDTLRHSSNSVISRSRYCANRSRRSTLGLQSIRAMKRPVLAAKRRIFTSSVAC